MSNIKKGLYIFIANILLFILIEITLTFFFVFHKSNYYGPIARLFLFEKKVNEKTAQYKMTFNKKTGKYNEGEYIFNNIKHNDNKLGRETNLLINYQHLLFNNNSLAKLDLSNSKLFLLPDSIGYLSGLKELQKAGFYGVALSFFDYEKDFNFFCKHIIPKLKKNGVI